MKKILSIFFVVYNSVYAQNVHDLIKKLPELSGKERITTLMDICYLLGPSDAKQAMHYGQQGLKLAYSTGDSLLIASCQNDVSIAYYYNANYDSTIYYAKKAYYTRLKHSKKRDAAASISKAALAFYEKGDFQEAIKHHEIALRLFEEEKKPIEVARTKSNIAIVYNKINMLPHAKKLYSEAADTCLKYKDGYGYLNAKANLAQILMKQDSLNKALDILLSLIPVCENYGNKEQLCNIYQNIGVIQKKLKNISTAITYLEKSNALSDSISDPLTKCINNINLGECYASLNQYEKAETLIKQGIEQAKTIQSKEWQKRGLYVMYELYKKKKDFKTAMEYLEKYQKLQETIFNDDLKKEIAKFDAKYNLLEKEKTILQQKNKLYQSELIISEKTEYIYILIGLFLLLIVTFLFVYQKQKVIQKEQKIQTLLKIQTEKQRIAKDLHDNLGAELTLISSLLDVKASQFNNPKDQKEMSDIADKAREASALMRDTIWATVNEELSISQIGMRIKNFAEKISKHTGIQTNYSLKGDDRFLSPDITLNLYRICQEIINNTVKHASAKNLTIQVNVNKNISISLEDDGKGFNTQETTENYGLKNIFARAESVGLLIQLQSELTKGTIYNIQIPNDKIIFQNNGKIR